MGKLNIAHHKSYHPYRRDNIEKVRRDEEEARLKEEKEEGRMMLADSEARIDKLRERADITQKSKKRSRKDDEIPVGGSFQPAALPTTGGHINFFEDLEHNAIAAAIKSTKKADPIETEKGVPLAPSAKDLKPWYSERTQERSEAEEVEDERRRRDTMRKSTHDPLTFITKQLSARSSQPSSSFSRPPPQIQATSAPPEVQSRLTRESSERERALALIKRRQREMQGSETPSTVHGGVEAGYGDQYNRREVEEAQRERERRWDYNGRRWDDDDRAQRERPRNQRRSSSHGRR